MSDNAYPNGELENLISQQREDTSKWQNTENHSPNPNMSPQSLKSDEVMPPVDRFMETTVAKVFVENPEDIEGGKVLLSSGYYQVVGRVITDAEEGFAVEWRTGRRSIEKKANYDLVVVKTSESKKCERCNGYGVVPGIDIYRGEVVGDTVPCPVCSSEKAVVDTSSTQPKKASYDEYDALADAASSVIPAAFDEVKAEDIPGGPGKCNRCNANGKPCWQCRGTGVDPRSLFKCKFCPWSDRSWESALYHSREHLYEHYDVIPDVWGDEG